MASWRFSVLKLTIVAMSAMPQMDCDPLSEPATRLQNCLERAIKQMKRQGEVAQVPCDLKMTGRYVVILHPPGEFTQDQLTAAGLPESLIPELRALRLRASPAIYVMAADRGVTGIGSQRTVLSSRETGQSSFVEINELMIIGKNGPPVTVEVGRTATTSIIRRIR